MEEQSYREEHKAASHLAATVIKQRETNAGTRLTFSFVFHPGLQPRRCCLPHLE